VAASFPATVGGLLGELIGADREASLTVPMMGQKRARMAREAVATLAAPGHLTGGLGLVASARRSKTTVPINQSPTKRTKPIPYTSPKTAGLVTPRLTILMPVARNDPSKKEVQIAAAARQKR
jgi:hypothetical protein